MTKIPNYEGYLATEDGQIYSEKSGKFLKQFVQNKFGYMGVNLYVGAQEGRSVNFKQRTVHTLILEAFKGQRPEKHQGCHLDGNPKNNHKDNLIWGSAKVNGQHKVLHGNSLRGEKNGNCKLTKEQAQFILNHHEKFNHVYLASIFGISNFAVKQIVERKTWVDLVKNRVGEKRLEQESIDQIKKEFVRFHSRKTNVRELASKYGVSVNTIRFALKR